MARKLTPKQYADVATGVRLSSHEKLCAERMKVLNERNGCSILVLFFNEIQAQECSRTFSFENICRMH